MYFVDGAVIHNVLNKLIFRRFRKIAKSDCVMSVRRYRTIWFPLDGFSKYFIFDHFFEIKTVDKIQGSLKSDKNIVTLHEDRYTFLIISPSVLFRMRNVCNNSCMENQNTPFVFSNFFAPENRAVCVIMWKKL
jgi:hypothetical protein